MIKLLMNVLTFFLVVDISMSLFIIMRKLSLTFIKKMQEKSENKYRPIIQAVIDQKDISILLGKKLNYFERAVVQKMLLEEMEHSHGVDVEFIDEVARYIGIIESNAKVLKSSRWWNQAGAAHILGLFKAEEAVPDIIDALKKTKNREVILKCSEALLMITGVKHMAFAINKLIELDIQNFKQITDLLTYVEDDPFYELEDMSKENNEVRKIFFEVISAKGDERIIPYIKNGLENEDIEVIISSLKASNNMGRIDDEDYFKKVVQAGDHEFWVIRAFVAKVLMHYDRPESIATLKKLLRDQKWRVRNNAGEALLGMSASGVVALSEMLQDRDNFAKDMSWQLLQTAQLRGKLESYKNSSTDNYQQIISNIKQYNQGR